MAVARKFTHNVLVNYMGQGWAALMAIAFLPIYVDYLGLEAYGLVGFFAVMQSLLAVFDLGVTPTLTREAARFSAGGHSAQGMRDLVRSFEYIGYSVAVLLVLGVYGVADYLASEWIRAGTLSQETVAHSISIMGVVFAARLLEGIYRGLLIGLDRQARYNLMNACLATARYAGAIAVLQYASSTLIAFFVWQAVISIISLAVLAAAAYACLPASGLRSRFSAPAVREVWRFSAGMAVVSGVAIAMANLDKFLLSGLVPLDQFGRYALASVAAGVLYTLVVPITIGIYPRMVGQFANADRAGLTNSHRLSSQVVAVVIGPAAFYLFLFSSEIIYVWSGNLALTVATSPILSVLALAAMCNCLGHLGQNLQQACGAPGILAGINAGALILATLGLPWAAAHYGLIGAAYAWLAVAAMQMVLTLGLAHRQLMAGEGVRWLLRDMLPPLAGALVMASLAYYWRPSLEVGRLGMAVFLAMTACLSAGIAAALAPSIRIRLKAILEGRITSTC